MNIVEILANDIWVSVERLRARLFCVSINTLCMFFFFFFSARYHPVSFYLLHFLILFPLSALSLLHYPQRDGFFAKLSSLFRSFISELLSEGVREVTLPWQQSGCFLASIIAASIVVVWILSLFVPLPHRCRRSVSYPYSAAERN